MLSFKKAITILVIISRFGILLLLGCATSPIDLQNTTLISAHESIVFGSFEIKDETNKIIQGTGYGCTINLIPKGSTRGFSYAIQKDGTFYWHLPKGCNSTIVSYVCPSKLKKFSILGNESSSISDRIFAHFVVPREKDATYVGKITVILSETLTRRFIIDDFDIAVKNFKIKYPEFKGEIVKSLMELEKNR